jgi:quercetin dioxygenase-like cupin family protein
MKLTHAVLVLAIALLSHRALAQDAFAFFRGDVFPPARSTPAAWLLELHKADDFFNANIAVAEFLPNTKLAWHNHPGGQILLITDGVGYYQERGKHRQIVRVGDVIKCSPGIEHWHGGAVESRMTYIAISPAQKGGTVWAQAVTDAEYSSPAVDRRSPSAARRMRDTPRLALHEADETFPFDLTSESFAPGKKPANHDKSGGQILIVTHGVGYYQEKGKPRQLISKGDVIKTAPDVEHWHGAASETGVTLVDLTPRR